MAGGHVLVWGGYGISTDKIMLGQYVSQKLYAQDYYFTYCIVLFMFLHKFIILPEHCSVMLILASELVEI
jgi:hypothetical protein